MNLNYTITDKRFDRSDAITIVIRFNNITAKTYDKICSIFSTNNEYYGDDLVFKTNFNKLIESLNKYPDEKYCLSDNTIVWLDENSFEQTLCMCVVHDDCKEYHFNQIYSRIEKYLLENL